MSLHIVFYEPEIPWNTGNIARTCGLTKSVLHLIRPFGFQLDDTHLKRAGLDYWSLVDIRMHDSFDELLAQYPENRFFFATTKANHCYSDFEYHDGDFFVFGPETRGLPKTLLDRYPDQCIRVPMLKDFGRSLNLSNSANIILYEALRQLNFPDMN